MQARPIGGTEAEGAALLAPGGSVIAIPFRGTVPLVDELAATSAGDVDALVLRYEPIKNGNGFGTLTYFRRIGNEGANPPTAIAQRDDMVAVATSFEGTIDDGSGPQDSGPGKAALITVIDSTGITLWSLVLRSDTDITVSGLALDTVAGSVTVAGTFAGTVDFGDMMFPSDGGRDGFVARIGLATPGVQWARWIGGAGDQHVAAMSADDFGNVYVAGEFEGELSVDGSPPIASDGMDAFVLRFAASGADSWSHVIGGPDQQTATAVATTPDYGVVVAGTRTTTMPPAGNVDFGNGVVLPGVGLVDGYAARLDYKDGAVAWARLFSGEKDVGEVTPRAVAVDCGGGITLAGNAADGAMFEDAPLTGSGKHDGFVHRMDYDGNPLWTRLIGGPEEDDATGVASRPDGYAIQVGGLFAGLVKVSPTAFQSAGAEDAFLVQLSP